MTYKENTNRHINGIIIKAKQGDGKAINTLLKELEPYVEEVLRCNGFKTELQDKTKKRNLIVWGQEGLYDAIRKFDFSFGVQFKTYAVQYILKMPRAEAQADRKWYARLHGEYNQNMGTEDEDEYAETQESPEASEEDETPPMPKSSEWHSASTARNTRAKKSAGNLAAHANALTNVRKEASSCWPSHLTCGHTAIAHKL